MNLNGTIMSKDKVVASVENGLITAFDEALLPFYLKKTKDVEGWMRGRAIDSHRTNSRLLKRALRIGSTDDMEAVLRVHAATITDTYWFRPEGGQLHYADVRFKENLFDKLALFGDPDSFSYRYSPTPELTNTGSFEKCWRLVDGSWWMYKSGNELQYFSELFMYQLGKRLGFDMAVYEMDGKYIRSADFTRGASVNFETAAGLVLDDEDYAVNYRAIRAVSETAAAQYVGMLYLDTLCYNMDRHTQNYGILRDIESGEVLSFAPLFDHNIALIANGYPSNIERKNDPFIRFLHEFLQKTPEAVEDLKALQIPQPDEDMIRDCCDAIPIQADIQFLIPFVLNADSQIRREYGMDETQDQDMTMQ